MRFRILGPLEVLSPGGWTEIKAAKWRSLLACLLVRQGQLVPTDSLIDELWGDNPPPTANNLVSIYVHRLRKVIGDAEGRMLVYRAPGYLLRLAPGDLDLQQFESRVADGRSALTAGDPSGAAALLGAALGLWRGPLLADVPPSALLATQADRAAELWLTATELRVEADIACGRAAQLVAELRGLIAEHPIRERLWLLLMRTLEDAGRRAEALAVYARAQEVISAELGVDPGAELKRFYLELLAADASAAVRPAPRPPRAAPARPASAPGSRPGETGRGGARLDGAGAGGAGAGADRGGAVPVSGGDATARSGALAAAGPDIAAAGEAAGVSSAAQAPGTIAIGTFAESAPAPATERADGPATATAPSFARPAQLPADIGDFTGRETHVDHLCELLTGGNAAASPGAVRIAVVNGAGGLGKTTLAVHAAHQVSARFPDGQLYVDLLGASPQAARPGEVLARFLRDLGVEGDRVPATDDERAALYRTMLTGRRVLILLDNARDAAQVRTLLPGSSSCAVLVTTRNRTPDLASTRFFDLDVLEDTEALTLFSRIVGEERAAAEPDATAEVLVACAGLPLAIRICAARLAARRQWKIATLAGRLRDQHRRLDELETGDLAVRASFQVSYDSLQTAGRGASPARAFRLLGLWPGAWISLPAAAALLGESERNAADALEMLVDVNLLESPAPDWYRFHDLLRVYATERAQAEESASVREEAVSRLLWWYLDTAEAAANAVAPQRYQVPRGVAAPAYKPLTFTSLEEALAWGDEERTNIVSATRLAAAVGLHEVGWRLPPTLSPVFGRRSNWADSVTVHRVGLECARAAGHRAGEAWVLNQLGFALARLRDEEAFDRLEQALVIRREFGDTRGEAQTAIGLAEGYLNLHGPGEDALRYLRLAVELLRPAGPESMLAIALNNLGEVYFGLGDVQAAEECFIEARDICREIGGHNAEGHALHNLGQVYQSQRRLDEAVTSYEEARRQHRASGELWGEAVTLKHLGEVQAETGDTGQGGASLSQALRIFEQIGNQSEADETAALLAALAAGEP
jgi:DNA-binding SARP family transcriptional activator/tetratricopeptide (TPR) repeat protein